MKHLIVTVVANVGDLVAAILETDEESPRATAPSGWTENGNDLVISRLSLPSRPCRRRAFYYVATTPMGMFAFDGEWAWAEIVVGVVDARDNRRALQVLTGGKK